MIGLPKGRGIRAHTQELEREFVGITLRRIVPFKYWRFLNSRHEWIVRFVQWWLKLEIVVYEGPETRIMKFIEIKQRGKVVAKNYDEKDWARRLREFEKYPERYVRE